MQLPKDQPLNLKILDETVRAKTKQLESLKAEHAQELIEHKVKLGDSREKLKQIKSQITDEQISLQKLVNIRSTTSHEVKILEKNKKLVQDEITERKHYRNEQEKLITETLEEGNFRLRGLGFEIRDIEERKSVVELDLYNLNSDKSKLIDEIEQIHDQMLQLSNELAKQKVHYGTQLEALKKQIIEARNEYGSIAEDAEKKLKELNIKEINLSAREAAYAKQQQELEVGQRRLENARAFYKL